MKKDKDISTETRIAIFKGIEVRKTIYENEWWFVIDDVVVALTDTVNARDYMKKLRKRDNELAKGWGQIVTPFPSRLPVENKK